MTPAKVNIVFLYNFIPHMNNVYRVAKSPGGTFYKAINFA
jgi:hypothetical protein